MHTIILGELDHGREGGDYTSTVLTPCEFVILDINWPFVEI